MSTITEPTTTQLPPPRSETGLVGWLRANLFSSGFNTVLTVVVGALAGWALWFGLLWLFVDSDFTVIKTLGGLLLIGQYNSEQACGEARNCFWRPQVALLLVTLMLGMSWAVAGGGLTKRIAILVTVVVALFAFLPYSLERMGWDVRLLLVANVPALLLGWALARYTALGTWRWVAILAVVAFLLTLVLLRGLPGVPGLQPVSLLYWGGLMLNLLLAVAGIVVSFPIGIALALGRRSRLPVVKLLCVVFIEVFRGVPLITLLFMSQVLVPLAFPENFPLDSLLRAAIIITLFSAAYTAENIRGGLQALHPGQAEAARALGLPGWQTTLLISLPQAIRNVIPAIVGQFIALFKDTSLVYIIGMLDIVELSRKFATSHVENGMLPYLDDVHEVFIFLAVVFWIFCFGMSYVSGRIERHLGVGER
ncbi:MAG: amino acid ABC transporter permease [Chloroflexi bacterium]|nr:amino acid ABC transporter permease [Chloroflexota bacterium]